MFFALATQCSHYLVTKLYIYEYINRPEYLIIMSIVKQVVGTAILLINNIARYK